MPAGAPQLTGLAFGDNQAAWVDEIAQNAAGILAERPSFVVADHLERLFGRNLGLARETHITKALKKLKDDGIISTVPTGKQAAPASCVCMNPFLE